MRTNFDKKMWTPEEVARLHELSKIHPARKIAEIIGRPFASVRAKMQRENLDAIRGQNWNAWSREEMQFLDDNHQTMSADDMAAALKRTNQSVKKKCWLLGLPLMRQKYSDEDVRLCKALFAEGVSREDIAEKMEVPYDRVIKWILGISRNNVQ